MRTFLLVFGSLLLTLAIGRAVLAGDAVHEPRPRWLGGVELGPGRPDHRWDARDGRVVRR